MNKPGIILLADKAVAVHVDRGQLYVFWVPPLPNSEHNSIGEAILSSIIIASLLLRPDRNGLRGATRLGSSGWRIDKARGRHHGYEHDKKPILQLVPHPEKIQGSF